MSASSPPSAKRRKLDLREEVVILVGPDKVRFTVHQAFLTKSSDFFKTCCNGDWKESETKAIELPDVSAEIFSIYYQFLCEGDLVVTEEEPDRSAGPLANRHEYAGKHFGPLVEMAIFADKYADIALANSVNDSLIAVIMKTNITPGPDRISKCYSVLPAHSRTLALLADDSAACRDPAMLKHDLSEYPHAFFHQIWRAMYLAVENGSGKVQMPTLARRCVYHEHNEQTPKNAECTGPMPSRWLRW